MACAERDQDVIIEDGHWMNAERDEKLADARDRSARAELHVFDLTFEQLWTPINSRNRDSPSGTAKIDRNALKRLWSVFEKPDSSEPAQFDFHKIYGADHGKQADT